MMAAKLGSALRVTGAYWKRSSNLKASVATVSSFYYPRCTREVCIRGMSTNTTFVNSMSDNFLLSVSMGHHDSGESQGELVSFLEAGGMLRSERCKAAMKEVDRAHFAQDGIPLAELYANKPLPVGMHAVISTPQMHALTLELLQPHLQPGCRGLDLGCGTGYLTACMALLTAPTPVNPTASTTEPAAASSTTGCSSTFVSRSERSARGGVVGVDHMAELVRGARAACRNSSSSSSSRSVADLLRDGHLDFVVGDGRLGLSEDGPFDCIHVGAAVEGVEAMAVILQQLRPGGTCLAPVGGGGAEQSLMLYTRLDDLTADELQARVEAAAAAAEAAASSGSASTLETILLPSPSPSPSSTAEEAGAGAGALEQHLPFPVSATRVMTVMCHPMAEEQQQRAAADAAERGVQGVEARRDALKQELAAWEAAYREANGGKRPGREQLMADPDARNAFLEFSRLNRRERVDLKVDNKEDT